MVGSVFAAMVAVIVVLGQTPAETSTLPSRTTAPPATSATPATPATPAVTAKPGKTAPVIVLDPGHSPLVKAKDKATGLDVSTYENEPEMQDVWTVATLVRAKLQKAGYRVVFTRGSLRQKSSLAQRAAVANRVHAALALSIHDQAGRNGGIGFTHGNNIVYYQSVGKYRATPSGKKVVFRNKTLAATSKRYGAIFAAQRRAVQRVKVQLRGDVGYDLGSRGLAAGNMWTVQLLSRVPWIYNEAGGNSRGRVGLNAHDKTVYANSLVAAVERCVPPPR